jgi:OHCU decarboxylase
MRIDALLSRDLQQLNQLPRAEAVRELLKCCGSQRWAGHLADERPFHEIDSLLRRADDIWWSLDETDWLEAFSHHPKIGEKRAAQEVSPEARRWSEEEQASAARTANEEMMRELVAANQEYERRFGFIFIVCATGKTTEEMLALIKERLPNEADTELCVAAEEQRRITHLRLKKLLQP